MSSQMTLTWNDYWLIIGSDIWWNHYDFWATCASLGFQWAQTLVVSTGITMGANGENTPQNHTMDLGSHSFGKMLSWWEK